MEKMIWKGYSIDELRYQRALTTIKCEMEKEKLMGAINAAKQGGFSLLGNGNKYSLMNKMLGALDFASLSSTEALSTAFSTSAFACSALSSSVEA